jgi:hypothetical protein
MNSHHSPQILKKVRKLSITALIILFVGTPLAFAGLIYMLENPDTFSARMALGTIFFPLIIFFAFIAYITLKYGAGFYMNPKVPYYHGKTARFLGIMFILLILFTLSIIFFPDSIIPFFNWLITSFMGKIIFGLFFIALGIGNFILYQKQYYSQKLQGMMKFWGERKGKRIWFASYVMLPVAVGLFFVISAFA